MDKPYPIGTAIKYIGYCQKCKGKIGKVVEITECNCWIVLPQSTCVIFVTHGRALVPWDDIELLKVKGQQLLFSFME